jgi:hypothetical protein
MKRVTSAVTMALLTVLVTGGNALAQTSNYPASPTASTSVSGGGGTAFTGSDVSSAPILIATLVVLGLAALLVARRRAAELAR